MAQREAVAAAEGVRGALKEALAERLKAPVLLPVGRGEAEAEGVGEGWAEAVGGALEEGVKVGLPVVVALPDSKRHVALEVAPRACE